MRVMSAPDSDYLFPVSPFKVFSPVRFYFLLHITYELFPGNTNDCLTYRPNFGRIKKQFDLGRVISVADKGMTTGNNIWYTINKAIKDYVLKEEGYEWLGTEYKRKSRKSPRTILVTSVTGKKMKKQVDEKQVVFWSEKYAKRAKAERDTALAKARDLAQNPGNYTRATSYGAAKYVKKIDYDKETGEILTASSILDIDEEKIREEEALDGYYMLLPCFVALTIARILENKLEQKYSVGRILDSLSKTECSLVQQNYYLFDYYDEVLKNIGLIMDIDFGKRIRTLGEIKKFWQRQKNRKNTMKKFYLQKSGFILLIFALVRIRERGRRHSCRGEERQTFCCFSFRSVFPSLNHD